MTRRAALALALLGMTAAACRPAEEGSAPPTADGEQRYLEWTSLPFAKKEFAARRAAFMGTLRRTATGAVHLEPARDGFSYGETFRQLDGFLYLTGLELPNAVLALDADSGVATVFAPRRDARFESATRPNDFPGRPLGDDPAIAAAAGIEVRPIEALDEALRAWSREGRPFFVDLGRGGTPDPKTDYVFTWSPGERLAAHLRTLGIGVKDARDLLARQRMVKSPAELEVLRRACAINAAAILHAARSVRDGVDERTLAAEFEAEGKRRGARRLAFDSIVKSGPNSLWPWRILATHADRRNRAMTDGELVIFDVGVEVDGYATDAGRTFPVSGTFTADQRRRVEMATAVSDAILAAIRPGVTFEELQAVADAAIPEPERPYMQTGLFFGHHIGLAVGDPSLADARLEAGMTFTVEPWYYNHDEELAVFLEDDVLVTADGVENLTATLPRTPEALEAAMR